MFFYCQVTENGLEDCWEGEKLYDADYGAEEDIEFDFEEHLSCAKFDGPEKEGLKIGDENDFPIGIKCIYCMEHGDNDADDEDDGNDNDMGYETFYYAVADGPQLWII